MTPIELRSADLGILLEQRAVRAIELAVQHPIEPALAIGWTWKRQGGGPLGLAHLFDQAIHVVIQGWQVATAIAVIRQESPFFPMRFQALAKRRRQQHSDTTAARLPRQGALV